MLRGHVFIILAVVSLCLGEEQNKRTARNPALLHLAHAGQSVGTYVGAAHGGGGGGGGPRIVIVGGQPAHVTTHVASKDSLEELDDELRQHYSSQKGYAPSQTGGFGNVHVLGGGGGGGASFRTGPSFNFLAGHHQAYTPLAVVGHPAATYPRGSPGHSVSQYPSVVANPSPTPSTVNYAPANHYSATPTPLPHTLATPVVHSVIPAKLPFHTSLPAVAPAFQGLRYTPLSHGPVFIPVQSFGHHQAPFHARRFTLARVPSGDYTPSHGNEGTRSHAPYDQEEQSRFRENVQERRPLDHYSSHQREYENSAERYPVGSENTEYDKNYKFGSNEVKSSDSPSFFSNFPSSDDKGSYEDSSSHEASDGERSAAPNSGIFKYSFADDHRGTEGKSYHGDGRIATSYQSVTLETHNPVSSYFNQKHQ